MLAVEAHALSFAYPGKCPILRELSFDVRPGEVFVLAGLSGCGKTTLCRILSGIIPHAVDGNLGGALYVLGRHMPESSLAETATHVGLVFQDVDTQLVCTTVEDELAFGLENLCTEPAEIRRRVQASLEEYHLEALRLCDPAQLSGGEKRRLAMAAVQILEPDLLILDEPMSNLDEAGQAMVRRTVESLRAAGKTVILSEHDLTLAAYADRCLVIRDGSAAYLGPMSALLANRERLCELELTL